MMNVQFCIAIALALGSISCENAVDQAGGSATIEGLSYTVSPRIRGMLQKVHVHEGDAVKRGDVLAEIECDEYRAHEAEADAVLASAKARLEQALAQEESATKGVDVASRRTRAAGASVRASRTQIAVLDEQIENAQRTVDRLERLRRNGGGTAKQLDDARTALAVARQQREAASSQTDAARAQQRATAGGELTAESQVSLAKAGIELARAEVDRADVGLRHATWVASGCVIKAAHDGVVQVRAVEEGEFVAPGSRMLTIVDIATVEATFYVANRDLEQAAPGRKVDVVVDAMPARTFKGVITRVSEQAEFTPRNIQTADDRDRLVYATTVRIDNTERTLRPGMPAEVRLATAAK